MKPFLFSLALLGAQLPTLQDKPVVHLSSHRNIIEADSGGKSLELMNAPKVINLPANPPKFDFRGKPWAVDIKNLGPGAVSVVGLSQFSVTISVNHTASIYSNGSMYSTNPPVPRAAGKPRN